MTNQDDIAAIERDLKAQRLARAHSAALARLEQNTDFQNLIKQAYLRDEAIRLVHLRSDPGAEIDGINTQLDAIAGLHGFFRVIRQKGELADKAIADGESMIEQLHKEG